MCYGKLKVFLHHIVSRLLWVFWLLAFCTISYRDFSELESSVNGYDSHGLQLHALAANSDINDVPVETVKCIIEVMHMVFPRSRDAFRPTQFAITWWTNVVGMITFDIHLMQTNTSGYVHACHRRIRTHGCHDPSWCGSHDANKDRRKKGSRDVSLLIVVVSWQLTSLERDRNASVTKS